MKCETVLPKNIRQIGEIQQNQRVYLEDYVMTFLRKKEKEAEQDEESCFAGILMGKKEQDEDGFCIFIRGALLMDTQETEKAWEKLEEEQRQNFPELEPAGCFVIGMLEEACVQEMMKHFEDSAFLIFHVQEGEENVYLAGENEYQRLKGYFIFYERNPGMQKYMTEHCREQQVEKEEGNSDAAILNFRKKVKEKAGERENRGMRYLSGSFLVLTVLVLGITIINNYDKLQEMEAVIAQLSQEQENQKLTVTLGEDLAVSSTNVGSDNSEKEDGGAAAEGEAQKNGESDDDSAMQNESADDSTQTDTSRAAQGLAERNYSAEEGLAVSSSSAAVSSEEDSVNSPVAEEGLTVNSPVAEEGLTVNSPVVEEGLTVNSSVVEEGLTANSSVPEGELTADLSVPEDNLSAASASAEDSAAASDQTSAADGSAETVTAGSSAGSIEESSGLTGRNGRSVYTVKYGDTLADISVRYYGSLAKVEEICQLNQIDDANLIVPGEKIVLP